MAEQKIILEKYVTFKENKHWKCKSCPHESSGHLSRMIAHLTRTPGKGIKICPNISPESMEELKRELGLGLHSTDVNGQQLQQPREKDDTRQEKENKRRKCALGSGTSGINATEAEMPPLAGPNSSSAPCESISISDGNTWSLQNLEKFVGEASLQLDDSEQNSYFSVSGLISSPSETEDAFLTVPPEKGTLPTYDQEGAYVPNTNNDGVQDTNGGGSELVNTIHQGQSSQIDSIQVSSPQGGMDVGLGEPIPPPAQFYFNHTNDQLTQLLQDGVGIDVSSTLGNGFDVGMTSAIVLAGEPRPPCPPGFDSDLWEFYLGIEIKGNSRFGTNFPMYEECMSSTDEEERKELLACLKSACRMARMYITNAPHNNGRNLYETLHLVFSVKKSFYYSIGKALKPIRVRVGEVEAIEKEVRGETEQGVEMLGRKKDNEMKRWLVYAANFKSDVDDLDVDAKKVKSPEEIQPLLKRIDELTKIADILIKTGTSLLNPILPKDLLSWSPTYMSCGSQWLNHMTPINV